MSSAFWLSQHGERRKHVQTFSTSVCRSEAQPTAVLHIFKYFYPDFTGEGLFFEKISSHLMCLGVRSTVVATMTGPGASNRTYPAEIGTPHLLGRRSRANGTAKPSVGEKLRRALWFVRNVSRHDVVHFHSAVDRHFVLHAISKLAGCRIVQSCTLDDGLNDIVKGYRPGYRRVARRLCHLIDHTVAISPRLYHESLGVLPPDRVHLIPQGVSIPPSNDDRSRADLRAAWGFARDDILLLFVGGICPRKDPMFLVENHPMSTVDRSRLRLLLVGPDLDATYAEQLQRLVASKPYKSHITRMAYLDDPSPVYRMADAFVFASRKEGFGNVLLEAMSFGVPVVARQLPGVTDSFIAHGRTGFLFENAEEYRRAVLDLAHSSELRRSIGDAARQEVAARFDLRQIAKRYAALYRMCA